MKRRIVVGFLVGLCICFNSGSACVRDMCISNDIKFSQTGSDRFDMVVIGPRLFSEELQPLIVHKNTNNLSTFFKTTEEIYNEYEGCDTAEQIKYFIKDAIEQYQITFVLLVGGRMGQSFRWYVPCRYAHVDDGYMHKEILSDLYFADVYKEDGSFEDWDSNGNNIFAEWTGMMPTDKMDLVPDVCLGRLPCRSPTEVSTIVEKIIAYENGQSNEEKRMLLVGGDTNPGIGGPFPFEGESCCEWTKTYLPDFTFTSLYTSDETLTSPEDFISAYNTGNTFVLYHGHGLQDCLVTYKPNSTETVNVFHADDINQLTNTVFPVTVVGCCQTTDFDTSLFNFLDVFNNMDQHHYFWNFKYECVPDCIGWTMVKQAYSGSIAHLGSSSTAWGSTGDSNHDEIPDSAQFGFTSGICTAFSQVYGQNPQFSLGEINRDALIQVIEENNAKSVKTQCKCVQEFILLGDPSLHIGR